MSRIFNFSAGPATLPLSVLKTAQDDFVEYKDAGMSVMEMSHRSKDYAGIMEAAEQDLRTLMSIPDNYDLLFMQGGATSQFSMVPLNLMNKHKKAAFYNTGTWSKKAIAEAKRYGDVQVVASSEDKKFSYIPTINESDIDTDIDYCHITSNNTIFGTRFSSIPKINAPIVSDMSSFILSETINVEDYGLIYAGAQKNIGPSGVTIVIVRRDLTGNEQAITPRLYNYKETAGAHSLYNTPPTYSIYIAGLVFKWLLDQGGVSAIEERNRDKAALVYDAIDNSTFYTAPVAKDSRSLMNIPFTTPSAELDASFIEKASKAGLVNLKGHRVAGGMRVSIYNAMPKEGVEALISFMKSFESEAS
jgi:phosphoserine aminotransferase